MKSSAHSDKIRKAKSSKKVTAAEAKPECSEYTHKRDFQELLPHRDTVKALAMNQEMAFTSTEL